MTDADEPQANHVPGGLRRAKGRAAVRALITGSKGFAGRHLVAHLRAQGDQVLGTAREATSALDMLSWDLRRPADGTLRARLRDFAPDCLYHLAGLSIPADCGAVEPTAEALAVNVAGTQHVLDLAAALPSRPLVLLISSNKVYAPVSADDPFVAETASVNPQGGYGKTKHEAELRGLTAYREQGLPVIVVRAFQHTGPGQEPRLMLPEWTEQFVRGGPAPVQVHSQQVWLDLSDVRDVVQAYRGLALRGQPGEIYNVGSGRNLRNGELLAELRRLTDPTREIVERYPGPKQEPIARIEKLTAATGWQPTTPLTKTLRDIVADWQARLGTSS